MVGPLHGLPVSLKDSFRIEGVQGTIGYVSFLEHPPASSNSALVNMLLDMGAVLYVKTNIPQTLMVCTQSCILPLRSIDVTLDWRFGKQHLRPHVESPQHQSYSWRIKWRRRGIGCLQGLGPWCRDRRRRLRPDPRSLLRHVRVQADGRSYSLWRANIRGARGPPGTHHSSRASRKQPGRSRAVHVTHPRG